jgi:hypothetical protein
MTAHEAQASESRSKAAAHNTARRSIALSSPAHQFIIQPKLTINQPNDSYEQEADMVADQVMSMASPVIQTKPFAISSLQRKCAHCEEEEKLHRKEHKQEGSARNDLESYIGNLSSKGQALPDEVRNFYEPRFGYDFSNVKVHTDSVAAKSAQSINALAYTNDNNIVFNEGQYSPGTDSGKRLLAHELTHIVQQGGTAVAPGRDTADDQAGQRSGSITDQVRSMGGPGNLNASLEATGDRKKMRVNEFVLSRNGVSRTIKVPNSPEFMIARAWDWKKSACHAACWAIGGGITAAVAAACAVGTTFTIGGLAIPCTAAVIATAAAAGGASSICSDLCDAALAPAEAPRAELEAAPAAEELAEQPEELAVA